jgi:hypothetical protein
MKTLTPTSIEKTVYGEHGSTLIEHETRIGLDFVYVGTYPGDANTTEDSPPFQNGWINEGGPWVPLRFRWQRDGYVEMEGCAINGSLGTPIFTHTDDLFIPDFDTPHVVTNSTFTFAVLVVHTDGTVTREA